MRALIDEYLLTDTGGRLPLFGSHAYFFVPPTVETVVEVLPDALYHPTPENRFTTPVPLLCYPVPSSWYGTKHVSVFAPEVHPYRWVNSQPTPEEEESFHSWMPIKHWYKRSVIDARTLEAIGWQWRYDTAGLLDEVLQLAEAEQFTEQCYAPVAAFVRKWGPLWTCRNSQHGWCYVPELWRWSARDPCLWAPVEEIYEFWRCAWEIRATLEIGKALRAGSLAPRALYPRLRFVGWHLAEDQFLAAHRSLLATEVTLHLNPSRRGLELTLNWGANNTTGPTLEFHTRMGFLHEAWMQATQLLCDAHGIVQCDGCKRFYVRKGRRPQTGRENFCQRCRDGEAAQRRTGQRHSRNLASKRLWAQRDRDNGNHARQLYTTGTRVKEIAQQLGVDAVKVERWKKRWSPKTHSAPKKRA
jgi:Putative ATPase subunit of terminase (gpP-like)